MEGMWRVHKQNWCGCKELSGQCFTRAFKVCLFFCFCFFVACHRLLLLLFSTFWPVQCEKKKNTKQKGLNQTVLAIPSPLSPSPLYHSWQILIKCWFTCRWLGGFLWMSVVTLQIVSWCARSTTRYYIRASLCRPWTLGHKKHASKACSLFQRDRLDWLETPDRKRDLKPETRKLSLINRSVHQLQCIKTRMTCSLWKRRAVGLITVCLSYRASKWMNSNGLPGMTWMVSMWRTDSDQ